MQRGFGLPAMLAARWPAWQLPRCCSMRLASRRWGGPCSPSDPPPAICAVQGLLVIVVCHEPNVALPCVSTAGVCIQAGVGCHSGHRSHVNGRCRCKHVPAASTGSLPGAMLTAPSSPTARTRNPNPRPKSTLLTALSFLITGVDALSRDDAASGSLRRPALVSSSTFTATFLPSYLARYTCVFDPGTSRIKAGPAAPGTSVPDQRPACMHAYARPGLKMNRAGYRCTCNTCHVAPSSLRKDGYEGVRS